MFSRGKAVLSKHKLRGQLFRDPAVIKSVSLQTQRR